MASKRRKAAAAVAAAPIPGAEGPRLKSPARRSSRRRGVAGPAREAESPGLESKTKGETSGEAPASPRLPQETSSYKTPTRRLVSRSRLATLSSPVNENDVQQEIFWDPHSPITHQLANERRKRAGDGHTVEISEIVDRIAPQDDKPDCYEGNLLGLWIGDDAIPCTPGIAKVRSRTKANGARGLQLRNREEELMKLAKQFDKNLTDAIQDQDASCHHTAPKTEMAIDHEDISGENREPFLGEHLQTNTALPGGVVEESSGRLGHGENSHREPLDLDAEVALNELFDGPTQALSQGLSGASSTSGFLEEQSLALQGERASGDAASAAGVGTRDPLQEQGSAAARTASPAEKAEAASEPSAPGVASSKAEPAASHQLEGIAADDFDDWGDDSFLMQITQNPELMGAPDNVFPCVPHHDGAEIQERTRDSKKPATACGGLLDSSEHIPATHILQKQSPGAGKASGVPLEFKTSSTSKHSPNKMSGCNPVAARPENKITPQDFTRLKFPANSSSADPRAVPTSLQPGLPKAQIRKYGSSKDNVYCHLSTRSADTNLPDLKSTPGLGWKPTEAPKKSAFLLNDWSKPKFSEEVLDSYCESDSLWGAGCDDDDLLYQVCDAVERNTQSQQAVAKEGKARWAAPSKLEAGPRPTASNQGLSDCPPARKTHLGRRTFSLDTPATVATVPEREHPSHPAAELPSKGERLGSVPGKWSRSHSVSEGDPSSGTGSPVVSNGHLNVSCSKGPNGPCNMSNAQSSGLVNPRAAAVKSDFAFRKAGQPQALALDHGKVSLGRLSGPHLGWSDSKKDSRAPLQAMVQAYTKPPFKRHLSESFAQPEAEQRSRKCSQEEIARKKQEALERRKWKMEALLKNTAPT